MIGYTAVLVRVYNGRGLVDAGERVSECTFGFVLPVYATYLSVYAMLGYVPYARYALLYSSYFVLCCGTHRLRHFRHCHHVRPFFVAALICARLFVEFSIRLSC